jgi:hypothetical protein
VDIKRNCFRGSCLLDLLGWERAGKWLDKMIGEVDKKEEKSVV